MAASINNDSVRIQISKTDAAPGGEPASPTMQTTIGGSTANSVQATNFLQAQLNALSNKSVNILRREFTYRELIFAFVALVFGITAFGLMITVILTDQAVAYEKKMVTCIDYDCYKSASAVQRKINDSYSACDNFYKYACAKWTDNQVLRGNEREHTILSEMEVENLKRLNDLVMGEIDPFRDTDWAYEAKMKKIFKTCLNQYQTTNYYKTSNPLLAQIDKMGGWYVLNKYDPYNWVKAHREVLARDNFVKVFFNYDIEPLDQRHRQFRITIHQDLGLGLPFAKWNIAGSPHLQQYKDLLKAVALLMAEDAAVSDSGLNKRIDDFVNDVVTVEKGLAEAIQKNAEELTNGKYEVQPMYYLDDIAYGFDWEYYFNATFAESKVPIYYYTEVNVKAPKTLAAVTQFLTYTLPYNQQRQMFNNYLVWRLIHSWLRDMSFEFNHLLLDFEAKLRGSSLEYKQNWIQCMETAQLYMGEALDGIYVRRHFTRLDKEEINYISESVRKSVTSQVGQLGWMDDQTRKVAAEKVANVIEKIGYPAFMDSQQTAQNMLDYTYQYLNVSTKDHFFNVLQLRQHARKEIAVLYSVGRDPLSDWRKVPLYSVVSTYFYPWNELMVPAGLLQFPIFSGYNPVMYRMMTYGSAGYRLARGYLDAIGENGQNFDKTGQALDKSWWSEATTKSYEAKKQCITDWYGKVQTDVLTLDNKEKVQKRLQSPKTYATQAILELGALRNAYAAYASPTVQSQPKTASELYLPGVAAKSRNEYFFLSFAQSYCAIRHDQVTFDRMSETSVWLPEELMVNNLLMQLPEFSSVFQCPAGSRMNPGSCSALF